MAERHLCPLKMSGWQTMASRETVADIFSMLKANWPKEPYSKNTLTLYWRCLGDIDDDILKAATVHCVTTRTFWPRIAELRQAAFEIMCNKAGQLTAGEAWAMVVRTASMPETWWAGGQHHKRSALPAPVQRALDAIGGWRRLSDSDHYSSDRARFLEAYTAFVKRDVETRQMLPEVRELAKAVAMDRKPALERY